MLRQTIVTIVLLALGPSHGDVPKLLKQLGDDSFTQRIEAMTSLSQLGSEALQTHGPELAKLAFSTTDPEIRLRATESLRNLYRTHILRQGKGVFGFELGWFIVNNGTSIYSQPMVISVVDDFPAKAAGFRPGDVIASCDGKKYLSKTSCADLKLALSKIEPGIEVTMVVRSSDSSSAYSTNKKTKKRTLKVASVPRDTKPQSTYFPEFTFQKWVTQLRSQTR